MVVGRGEPYRTFMGKQSKAYHALNHQIKRSLSKSPGSRMLLFNCNEYIKTSIDLCSLKYYTDKSTDVRSHMHIYKNRFQADAPSVCLRCG